MSAAKPTYMRPVLEAAIASGELTREMRKAAKWSIVTIDALAARLAEAEAARDEREAAARHMLECMIAADWKRNVIDCVARWRWLNDQYTGE